MTSIRRERSVIADAAAWYLDCCPIQRGKGLMNRMLGKFIEIRIFDDIKLRLIDPLEYNQKVLLFGKEDFEPDVTRALFSLLRPGMTFFDIGANLGYYTLLASKIIGDSGQVHSFEPAPAQFRHLKLNLNLNRTKNVTANNLAVAGNDSDRELFLADTWNHGTNSFIRGPGRTRSCVVKCTSIDDYAERSGSRPIDVMKVDVEGAELFVLKGAQQNLAAMPPSVIILEACEEHAQAHGYATVEVKRLLVGNGYRIFRLDTSAPPIEVSQSATEGYANLIALHDSAESWYYRALRAA